MLGSAASCLIDFPVFLLLICFSFPISVPFDHFYVLYPMLSEHTVRGLGLRRKSCKIVLMARLLVRVKNISSWRQHKIKAEIYENLPPISSIVNQRKAKLAGHRRRAKEEIVSNVLFLKLKFPNRGRRPLNFIDCFVRETNIQLEDLPTMMKDRGWKDLVKAYLTAVA